MGLLANFDPDRQTRENSLMRLFSLLVFSTLIALLASCARSIRDGNPRVPSADDSEHEANRDALVELMRREAAQAPVVVEPVVVEPEAVPVLPVVVLERPPSAAELGEGVIERSDLLGYIEDGPHHLLTSIQVEPITDGSAIHGFRPSVSVGCARVTS